VWLYVQFYIDNGEKKLIEFLEGKLIKKTPSKLLVEVQGVGYGVEIPFSVFNGVGEEGETVKLYTYLYIKENIMKLYGFLREEEKEMFSRLVAISGVGPRTALGILSRLSPEEFEEILASEDFSTLSSIPGVGKKLCQKIFLELKGKYGISEEDELTQRSVEALVGLGSSVKEAKEVVRRVRRELPGITKVEEVVKEALKRL